MKKPGDMKGISSIILASALATALMAGAAQAQFIYSPPPPLMGQQSYHLYTVPGVMEGVIDTFFECTNTTSETIRVGIEIFGDVGGGAVSDPSASSLEILSGGTRLFGTRSAVWVGVDSVLGGAFGSTGSARILATKSKGIICTAFLADAFNVPPASMADLTVVKKTKQKGD